MNIKLPLYETLNILFIGVFFATCNYIINMKNINVKYLLNIDNDFILYITFFIVSYMCGLIINRLGSIIEELLKIIPKFKFNNNYALFCEKEKNNSKLSLLSRRYASSRSCLAMFLVLLIESLCVKFWFLSFVYFLCLSIFVYSTFKDSSKICNLLDDNNEK